MAKRGTDHWSETYCDRRFHPPHLTGLPALLVLLPTGTGPRRSLPLRSGARSFERGHPGLRNRLLANAGSATLGR